MYSGLPLVRTSRISPSSRRMAFASRSSSAANFTLFQSMTLRNTFGIRNIGSCPSEASALHFLDVPYRNSSTSSPKCRISHPIGFSTGSPNILMNRAGMNSRSRSCARARSRSIFAARFRMPAIRRCSSSGGSGTGSDISAFMSVRGIRAPVTDAMTYSTVSFRRSRYAMNSRSTPSFGRSGTNSVEHLPGNPGVATLFRYGRSFA